MTTARLRGVLAALFVLLAAAFVYVAGELEKGEEALIQRKYKEAVGHLSQALKEEPREKQDRVMLLLGRAQWLAGDVDAAVATYRALLEQFPQTALRSKARFQQAEALAAARKYQDAAVIYRDEIERLTSLERKEEIAGTYLELAQKALAKEPKDHARAVTFFDLALDLGLSKTKARITRLLAAESKLAAGDPRDAIARFTPLVKELEVADGKLRAMLGLGRARSAAGEKAAARTVLRDLIALSPQAQEAADAAYEIAVTYGIPTPEAKDLDRAVAALEDLAQRYPSHEKAKIAWYLIARCYQHVGRTEPALAALRKFLAEHASEGLAEVAAARAMLGDVLAAQGKLNEAIEAWRAYLKAHPAHGDWERVQRAIVDTEYGIAMRAWERGKEHFDEARELLVAFTRSYPLDPRNPDIAFLLGEMHFVKGEYQPALEELERCVSKYPGKDASSHAQFRIGEIFEQKLFDYHKALTAYRKVTWGPWQAQAQQRIALLERKHMALLTPHTYRTGDVATFDLTSRNIEKVRVRVFKLDLETYFRATHTAGDVSRLDIEVIEPDKTFDSAVPEYRPHQETTRKVDIGFKEAGAYVVKVDDRELEATTMVIVTDLALIAKSSRHELFVLTQNVKEERVEGGAKIVLSDGKKVIAEGTTGTDGVWRYKGPELKNSNQLSVFSVNAAGSGAGTLDLSGMGYSEGLTPVGYLFTDRPAYQPGQTVHVKGIVREAKDGLYHLPSTKDYRVQVFTAGGRLMLQRDVEFTEFGSFAADLALPPEAELGEWRVHVDRGVSSSVAFTGTFQVARYERPRLLLTAEPTKAVVYRGETIEGKLTVRYFFGEPAQAKKVHYVLHLPDGGQVERDGVTNAAGEVAFTFDTKEFAEEALAVIDAAVVEEEARTRLVVPVVTTEFTPVLSMVRSVYLTGEPFDVTVEIKDRSGKALAQAGTAKLLWYDQKGGRGEVEVESKPFTTEAKTGKVRVTFTGKQGGRHVVRVESKDRFGVVVTAQIALEVSGQDDEIKLRLLSDVQHYRVGETAKVKVMNRAGAHLVLRTIQGDGILAYDTFVLAAGESELSLPLATLHAPNFALSLAMIDGNKLHVATRALEVSRELRVSVESPKGPLVPGSEAELKLTALDAKGQPVAAEIAIALVDQALLTIFPDTTAKMTDVFYGRKRETDFRTVASNTWSYVGAAKVASGALLAEERRQEEMLGRLLTLQDREGAADEPKDGAKKSDDLATMFSGVAKPKGEARTRAAGPVGGAPASDPAYAGQAKAASPPRLRGLSSLESEREQLGGENARFKAELKTLAFGQEAGNAAQPLNEVRKDFSETGGWVSAVVTGADGKGAVKITLPDSTTSWTIKARAVTKDTDVGESDAKVETKKSLQADIVAPAFLTEGDRTELRARVHNLTGEALALAVKLAIARGTKVEEPRREARDVKVEAGREAEPSFELKATSADDLSIDLAVEGGGKSDHLRRDLVVHPFGIEQRAGRAGSTTQGASFKLSLPPAREYGALSMAIDLGPDPGRDLVKAALAMGYRPVYCRELDSTNLALASHGFAALQVLHYLERSGGATAADTARLRGLATAAVTRLIAAQCQDGGIPWVGSPNAKMPGGDAASDLRTTSQAVLFLAHAKQRGIGAAEDVLNKAAEWLLRNAPRTNEERARAELALASAGRARFESLNTLHRARASLDLESLARLTLAWQHENRGGLADEVIAGLREKLKLPQPTNGQTTSAHPQQIEAIALAAAALLQDERRDPLGAQAVRWLDGQRRGVSWGTSESTAAALWALVTAGGSEVAARNEATIVATVNGREVGKVAASGQQDVTHFTVPADVLREKDNQIEIKVEGRGEIHYAVMLTGFAHGFDPKDRRPDVVQIDRKYLPALLRYDGKVVQPGFGVVRGNYEAFETLIDKVNAGESARVQTSFYVHAEQYQSVLSPLIVEEPIPAGCTVPPDSIQGGFDHLVVEPDKLTFYYREGRHYDTVHYDLQARFVGEYRVVPTRVFGALRPDLLAHGPPNSLAVKPAGSTVEDRRLTPDELYHLGKALFEDQKLEAAGKRFAELLRDWQLREVTLEPQIYKEVARMMLFISVERRDAKQIVHFFEELKDRYPELSIPFDKIVAVGKAYLDLGEFESAVMVFRGTAEASYLKEAGVATTLEQMGEVKASIAFLMRLLQSYPDLNTIRVSLYSIGQRLAALAAAMPPGAPVDEKVGRRDELRQTALAVLREFLVLYPEDPMAEEVSFAWATTHLEGGDLKNALAVAQAALARYPNSVFEDELLYTAGYAHFVLGQHEQAFADLKKVAEGTFPKTGGGRGPSENQWHAVYLEGQIHHALNEPAKALAEYERVADKFADAAEAKDYFLRKELSVPEVTTFPLKDAPELTLTYRNLKEVDVKIYRVDLMRLYLMEKSLNDIRGVQLYGIRPHVEQTVPLGDGKDYRQKEKKLALDLKEPGAYLVVLRGGDLLTTGMVLRTDLEVDTQEDLDAGRIRVNVKRDGAFVGFAHVKVIGSGNTEFKSGDTDLRGIFVAGDLVGRATVIVKKADEYAFYRGTAIHQPARYSPPPPQPQAPPQGATKKPGAQFDALRNNLDLNDQNRSQQLLWLQNEVMNKQQKGVEVYRTK